MYKDELITRRKEMRLTQAQLAERLGVTVTTVARWEQGQRQIPLLARNLLQYIEDDIQRERLNATPEQQEAELKQRQREMDADYARAQARAEKSATLFDATRKEEKSVSTCPTCGKRKVAKDDTVCRTCRRFITDYIETGAIKQPRNYADMPMVADVLIVMRELGVTQDRAVIMLGGIP